jgi:fatty-acyl-CoA synthase
VSPETDLKNMPHAAIWPKRLPRSLVIPETSLWFNLEVAAKRYPNRAAYVFFGRELSIARLKPWPAGCRLKA